MTAFKDNPIVALICICAILIATSSFVGAWTLTNQIQKQAELEQKVTRLETKIENMEENLKLIPSIAISVGRIDERIKQWEATQ